MKVLTFTLYKEHCDLCTEIHGSNAVNSCQIKLAQKDIILLLNVSIIVYKAGKRTGMENNKFIHFNLSVGTYSIQDFNAKIRAAVLQQRQDWETPQIKNSKLVITEHYIFMTSNTIFITLGIPDNYLEKTTKHQLIHHLLQNHCHCTINKSIKLETNWIGNQQVC